MKDGESEFEIRFGMTPFFDVPKIEHQPVMYPKNPSGTFFLEFYGENLSPKSPS